MNNAASALTGAQGERIALRSVSVSAVLRDLLAEVTVSQTYRNEEQFNIEAVYTFPLPLDAVLLELQVEIGGRRLTGVVVEKQAAEEQYEDAVDRGDSAVMLELIEPGLYTMNVGNLLPREQATITFTYAIVYRWAGDRLRFFLPTTVAPRYGESPHLPHQAPEYSLTVENQFALQVEILGSLREAQFTCPSHEVSLTRSADKTVISLQQAHAAMDRDFILNIRTPQAARSFVQCGADGEGAAALASFQPFFPGLQQPRPLNLAIVIDCSGSMKGDSMEQAKQALEGILDALQPHDNLTLIAFGSTTSVFSERLLSCNKTNLARARRFAKQLDANMGGTEIGRALQAAYAAVSGSQAADIFLVTDGEVSSWESVVQEAKSSGHRIFTVGVGSAVSEAFMRGLAAGTGGECELVAPREGMADRVVRHFERMRAPRARRVDCHWPEGAQDLSPATLGAVFEGDTVIVSARFDHPAISGSVVLEVETERGDVMRHELPISAAPLAASANGGSTVARLAAAARLKDLDGTVGPATALRYRLISPWTHWLVIAERLENEKAQDLPELRKVPQTLAAGWGGVGQVQACSYKAPQSSIHYLDIPCFLINRPDDDTAVPVTLRGKAVMDLPAPFCLLLDLIENEPHRLDASRSLELLQEAGLDAEFEELFRRAEALGLNIHVIAVIVLAELLAGPLRKYQSSETRRAVRVLRNHTRQAVEAIREMGHLGMALTRVARDAAGHDILQPGQAQNTWGLLERMAEYRSLLDHVQLGVKHAL